MMGLIDDTLKVQNQLRSKQKSSREGDQNVNFISKFGEHALDVLASGCTDPVPT